MASAARVVASLSATLILVTLVGCGATSVLPQGDSPEAQLDIDSACPALRAADAGTLVVLDWDGGYNSQLETRLLSGFSTAKLTVEDAGNAAALDDAFRSDVLARAQEILCVLNPMDIAVIEGDAVSFPLATIVHITADEPTTSAKHIGQAHFDPCNEHPDDGVIIWGGALASRIDSATYRQWVNAFANTVAHEVGHTLGFSHPDEEVLARVVPQPAEEVMRGKVTIDALLAEQYFLLEQDTCPGSSTAESYSLVIDDM